MKKLLLLSLLLVNWVAAPRCYYDLEMNFFDRNYVMEAMDIFNPSNVYQSQWSLVYVDLMRERAAVPGLVKERARKMRPNPLDYPFQSDKAEELLLKVQYEIFAKVIKKHANVNDEAVQGMFKYIVERQSPKLEACFGKKERKQDNY